MTSYVTQLYAMADREPQQGVVDAAGVTAGARQGKAAAGHRTDCRPAWSGRARCSRWSRSMSCRCRLA